MQPTQLDPQFTQPQQFNAPPKAPIKPKPIARWIVLMVMPVILLLVSGILSILVTFSFNKATTCTNFVNLSVSTSSSKPGTSGKLTDDSAGVSETSCDNGKSNPAKVAIRLVQILLGISAVLCIFLEPLWIVMLVRASKYNSQIPRT